MVTLLLLCCLVPDAGVLQKASAPPVMPPADAPPMSAEEQARKNAHVRASKLFPDLVRFPDLACATARRDFLDRLELWLLERQRLGLDPEHTAAWLDDVRTVKGAWDTLHQIRFPFTAEADRASVEKLRRLLGEEAWWRGQMPDLDRRFFVNH